MDSGSRTVQERRLSDAADRWERASHFAIGALWFLWPVWLLAIPSPGDPGEYRDVESGSICQDGWRSYSQGRGTCSHHGGVARTVEADTVWVEATPGDSGSPQAQLLFGCLAAVSAGGHLRHKSLERRYDEMRLARLQQEVRARREAKEEHVAALESRRTE